MDSTLYNYFHLIGRRFPWNCVKIYGLDLRKSIRFFQRINKAETEYSSYKFFQAVKSPRNSTWARYPISRKPRWRIRKLRHEVSPSRLNVKSVAQSVRGGLKFRPITLKLFVLWIIDHKQDKPRNVYWRCLQSKTTT